MQKYVLVCLLKKMDEGYEFPATNWPLHVTVAPRFAVDWESTGLFEKLSALLAKRKPIEVPASGDEYFGPQKQVQVTVLDMSSELVSLHNDVTALLKSVGSTFDQPEYLEKGYRAHVTVQPDARIHKGDSVRINDLTMVDMFPDGDVSRRKLLRTIKFSE